MNPQSLLKHNHTSQYLTFVLVLVSLGVIAVSLSVAFNAWMRSMLTSMAIFFWDLVSFLPNVIWAVFVECTGLRRLWQFASWRLASNRSLGETKLQAVNKIYSSRDRRENKIAVRRAALANHHMRRDEIPLDRV